MLVGAALLLGLLIGAWGAANTLVGQHCLRRPTSGGIVALGDSITAGRSRPALGLVAQDSWFGKMVCRSDDLPYGYNAGVHGEATGDMILRLDDVLERSPRLVVLLAGTNDIAQGTPLDATLRNVRRIVRRTRAQGSEIVIATVPPRNDALAQNVLALNQALRRDAWQSGVPVVDFHRELTDDEGQFRPGLSTDAVHPNSNGAGVMADTAEPLVRRMLARDRGRGRATAYR